MGLKEILRKPAFLKSVIGGLLLINTNLLLYQNFNLKKQNKELSENFKSSVNQYKMLQNNKYNDSIGMELNNVIDILNMQAQYSKLMYFNDSLEEEHMLLSRRYIDLQESRIKILNESTNLLQENEFCKSYVNFLDSLLFQLQYKGRDSISFKK